MSDVDQSPIQITESNVDELRKRCREQPGQLFAILDACDEPRVPAKVLELGNERAVSLYRGKAKRDYWAIAPYLVQVDEQVLDWIIDNLWDDPWGFFAFAATDLAVLRKHFRQFLTVKTPDGEELLFRFYDPRVLSDYLETCSGNECKSFFGDVDAFCISGDEETVKKISPATH